MSCTVGNNIFLGWAAQHWRKLPREAGESPSSEGLWLTVSSTLLEQEVDLWTSHSINVWSSLPCQQPFYLATFLPHPPGVLASWLAKGTSLIPLSILPWSLLAWPLPPSNHPGDLSPILICHCTETKPCLIFGISSLPCTTLISVIF